MACQIKKLVAKIFKNNKTEDENVISYVLQKLVKERRGALPWWDVIEKVCLITWPDKTVQQE